MYKHNTFGEILKLLNKDIITKAVSTHKSDKYSRGFNTQSQLVAMLFGQLSKCKSLRDFSIRFNAKSQCHYHLKSMAIKRSTLSDANRKRNNEVFRDIAIQMIKGQNREIKDVVSLIDSSLIRIDGIGYEWTKATKTRYSKGLKLHIQCGSTSEAIEYATITGPNVNDITEAKKFNIEAGKIYVFAGVLSCYLSGLGKI